MVNCLSGYDNTTTLVKPKQKQKLLCFPEKKITSTPLLEYIASKKVERREERKKKIDERKRQREDDRSRKKSQVVKSIPSSIREQVAGFSP